MKKKHILEKNTNSQIIAKKLKEGLSAHQCGDVLLAKTIYESILTQFPSHSDALHLLGLIYYKSGEFKSALFYIEKSISIQPNNSTYHLNLGSVQQAMHEYDEAIRNYTKAININCKYAEAYTYKGNAFKLLKKYEEAIVSHEMAISLRPNYAEAYLNLGTVYKELNRLDDAIIYYSKSLDINSNLVQSWVNIGVVLNEMGKFSEAQDFFSTAIKINPKLAEAWSNKGISTYHLGDFNKAVFEFDKAIDLNPKYFEAWTNKGLALGSLMKNDESIDCFDIALAIKPDHAEAQCNKSMVLLRQGDYEKGWPNYESRFSVGVNISAEKVQHKPVWNGSQSLGGKTIYLYSEQGLGDTIQFCRYAKLVNELGARVILQVQNPLFKIMNNLEGVNHLIREGDFIPYFDYQCSLLSLPLAFKTLLNSIPNPGKYLFVDNQCVEYWKEKIVNNTKLKIGIVWNGGFRISQPELWSVNERRNIPLLEFSSALNHLDIDFYSLQKGEPAESEIRHRENIFWPNMNFINYADQLVDFYDTAALIENMDIVISVDTSTAHLAAALGKPTWILNRYDSCWRWLLDRQDSPWYRTVKLYRQSSDRSWAPVLDELAKDLVDFKL